MTSVAVAEVEATLEEVPGRSLWKSVLRQWPVIAGLAILALLVLVALLAPLIAPYGEHEKVGAPFEPPSWSHPLGLDDGGIDMASLMLFGSRVSLIVGFAAAVVAMLIGGTVGLLSGYFGGRLDTLLNGLANYVYAIPDIPLILVVAAIWGRSLTNIILIIGVIYWASVARIVRAEVKSLRERVYVKRVRSLGAGHTRTILHHVLPQVAALLVALTVLQMAYAIFLETSIAFLGLGDPRLTSWGKLIENAFQASAISVDAWWAIVPPGLAVVVVVLACTMVGRAVEDALNPRLRVGHVSVHRFRLRQLPPDVHRAEIGR
jgi:peptide/nickel transport system permease protein